MAELYTIMVPWDDILGVLRRACPKLGMYGGDKGGDAPKMLAMLRDDTLVERVAKGVWDAQIARDVAMRSAGPVVDKAQSDYAAALKSLSDSL